MDPRPAQPDEPPGSSQHVPPHRAKLRGWRSWLQRRRDARRALASSLDTIYMAEPTCPDPSTVADPSTLTAAPAPRPWMLPCTRQPVRARHRHAYPPHHLTPIADHDAARQHAN